jgi:hypothetical protein
MVMSPNDTPTDSSIEKAVEARIETAIETAQALIAADGSRLEVIEASADGVRFRLDLEDASCVDCVLPVAHLTSVIGDTIRRVSGNPDLVVEIDDPRVSS